MKACLKIAAAIVFCSAVTLPAFAQEETENVTVFAPYVVKKSNTGLGRNHVTTVSVSRAVAYDDLDLTSPDGQATLETRVKQTANDVCKELDKRYPASMSENKTCVREAVTEAMVQVKGVEKAAKG